MNQNYLMPHGVCLNWNLDLLSLHLISDAFIALSYFSIPLAIIYYGVKRGGVELATHYYIFSAFIAAYGVTHIFNVLTLWHPLYIQSGIVKSITAAISFATALYFIPRIPKFLSLPNLDGLLEINDKLKKENNVRRRIERKLNNKQTEFDKTHSKLNAIIKTIPSSVFWTNAEGEIIGGNPAFMRILATDSWREDTQLGDSQCCTPFVDKREVVKRLSDPNVESWYSDLLISNPNGHDRYITALLIKMEDNDGALGSVSNITPIKSWPDKQLAVSTHHDLSGELLSRANHELRTPLNSILGYIQILNLRHPGDDSTKQYLDKIDESSRYLLHLVNNMLDLSRMGSGDTRNKTETVNACDIVDECIESLKPRASNSGVEIRSENQGQSINVIANKRYLFEVIHHVVSNGIKYHGELSCYVFVSIHSKENEALIIIRDNGVGMDLIDKDAPFRLFNRMEQVGGKISGSGIGLSTCKKMMELMGGHIELESRDGLGTTVTLKLPR